MPRRPSGRSVICPDGGWRAFHVSHQAGPSLRLTIEFDNKSMPDLDTLVDRTISLTTRCQVLAPGWRNYLQQGD